jgi:hypothetical protein
MTGKPSSGRHRQQFQLELLHPRRHIDRDRLRLQHALVHLPFRVEHEVTGVGAHRHRGRQLRRILQAHAGQGGQHAFFDVVRGADLEAQRHHVDQFQRRDVGRDGNIEGGLVVDLARVEHAVVVEGRTSFSTMAKYFDEITVSSSSRMIWWTAS